jgi:hypothetical protein
MENLGLKIEIISFLSGMNRREKTRNLAFKIFQYTFKVAEFFRFESAHEPDDRRLDFNCQTPRIQRKTGPIFPDCALDEFVRVADMGGGTDAGSKEYHAGLLSADGDPAGSPFRTSEITFSVRAETAEIAEWQVERRVSCEEFFVPVAEGSD